MCMNDKRGVETEDKLASVALLAALEEHNVYLKLCQDIVSDGLEEKVLVTQILQECNVLMSAMINFKRKGGTDGK